MQALSSPYLVLLGCLLVVVVVFFFWGGGGGGKGMCILYKCRPIHCIFYTQFTLLLCFQLLLTHNWTSLVPRPHPQLPVAASYRTKPRREAGGGAWGRGYNWTSHDNVIVDMLAIYVASCMKLPSTALQIYGTDHEIRLSQYTILYSYKVSLYKIHYIPEATLWMEVALR